MTLVWRDPNASWNGNARRYRTPIGHGNLQDIWMQRPRLALHLLGLSQTDFLLLLQRKIWTSRNIFHMNYLWLHFLLGTRSISPVAYFGSLLDVTRWRLISIVTSISRAIDELLPVSRNIAHWSGWGLSMTVTIEAIWKRIYTRFFPSQFGKIPP